MKRSATTPKALAAHLRDCRFKRGLTQAELGKHFGIKQKTISKFENSPESSTIDTFFKLLAALELELILMPREESIEERKNVEW